MEKKIVLSGIQPSGVITLGNYVGAVRNWSLLQQEDRFCYYCVANLHAITVRQDPLELKRRTRAITAMLLACGVDPNRSALFIQSDVAEHSQLAWVLDCYTYMGELSRMTQFKDKSAKNEDNINAGLFTYPVLMASDILLYQSNYVPVGHDQKQHVEIARDIAIRFNNAFGNTFVVPEPLIPQIGGRVMSLLEPTKKMSKSDPNPGAYIAFTDDEKTIMKKFKRAVTDSEACIAYNPQTQPGVANLLSLFCTFTGKTMDEAVAHFSGLGYGHLKTQVAEAVIAVFAPLRLEYERYLADEAYLQSVLDNGAAQARQLAHQTLVDVYNKVGFGWR